MIRIGAFLGLLAGVLEASFQHGLRAWGGSSAALLAILAIYTLGGAALGCLLRLAGGARDALSRAVLAAWIAAVCVAVGIVVYAGWSRLAEAALVVAVTALGWALLRWARGRRVGAPGPLPMLSTIGLLLLAGAIGIWAVGDLRATSPIAPMRLAERGDGLDGKPQNDASAPRVVMIGLDGGTWDVILPLVDRGLMPNLERLLADGVGGVLRSTHDAFSPIVWTTVTTGKTPDKHGLDDLTRVRSTNRRVRQLWSILGDEGYRSLVANVPGTFPVEPIEGVMLGGFPVQKESINNLGHLYSTLDASDWTLPAEMQLEPIELSRGEPGERRGRIVQREVPAMENATVLTSVKRALWGGRSLYGHVFGATYTRIGFVERDGKLHFDLGGERSLALGAGEWSPWIVIDRERLPLAFRLHVLAHDDDELSIYTTPLFRLDPYLRIQPPELAARIDQENGPYVIEGAGWLLFQAPRLLQPLLDHQFDVSTSQYDVIRDLWSQQEWDALFYVITIVDRLQHGYWSFIDETRYRDIPEPPRYPYADLDPETSARFEDVVERTYLWSDRAIGELLERAGPETIVVLLSDHGATSGEHANAPAAGIHHPDGFYLFAGGPFSRGAGAPRLPPDRVGYDDPRLVGEPLRLQDITPTLLAALGRPVALDFDGGPSLAALDALARAELELERVDTYESGEVRAIVAEELDESQLEQLRSLGYVK